MPRISRLLARTASALLVPIAVLATAAGSVAADSFARTQPYTLVSGWDPVYWCEGDSPEWVGDDAADLRGLHFAVSIGCLFRAASVPERQAAANEGLRHLPPAAPGTELLFVQFAKQPDYVPEIDYDSKPVASWIEIGDERIDLEYDPEGGLHYVLGAPVGEPAVLWMEEEGRAQGLDLRTGAQVEPIAAYYNDVGFGTRELSGYEYEEVVFRGDGGGWRMTCSSGDVSMTRAAWDVDRGWAPEGTVFIEFRFWWCGSAFDSTAWTLDTDEAVQMWGDSETLDPVEWIEASGLEAGSEIHTAVFTAPADAADFTAFFSPIGVLTEKDGGDEFELLDRPSQTDWRVVF